MRARTLTAALLLLLFWALPAASQEQRGAIEGIVRDVSGGVLPGATVEAKAENGAVIVAATDGQGVYRFPSVAPGNYVITAKMEGFTPKRVDEVAVGLGQVKKVDFALALGGVTESVQVTGESPLVDVRQSARQTNIRSEQLDLLPKGRDFTTLVTQAPGANNETKLGGLSIDGASAGENRYIVDGIETTDLKEGLSGKSVIADFVDEVQVKSSGYTAEFGGATGGVINVLTKSGTNSWQRSALFTFQGSALGSGVNGFAVPPLGGPVAGAGGIGPTASQRTLRLNPTDSNVAEYVTYPEDEVTQAEVGFTLGGPIVLNRAWFFGAYLPSLNSTGRTVTAASAQNPAAEANSNTAKTQVQYATANATTQMSDQVRGRIAFNNSWTRTKGLVPSLAGTDPAGSDYRKVSTFPNWSASGNIDWVVSSHLFFGFRSGYYYADQYDSQVTEVPRYNWPTTNNINYLDVPAALQRGTGFSVVLSNNKTVQDQRTRANFQADGTVYGNMFGSHQLKFGVQADRLGNSVDLGEAAGRVTIRWNAALSGVRGKYGYYSVRSNGADPRRGFITTGDVSMDVLGFFVQDAWTINNRLTVNAGVRTERETVPYYAPGLVVEGVTLPPSGIEFGFADKVAPRVGFAYDVKGDGRWKAFGSWGVFYDIFKLELPRGSFGGDKWLEYYYTLDTYDWPTLVNDAACPPACPGTLLRTTDYREISVGSDAIDPNIKPMRQQEGTAGIEHQLNDRMSFSVRYVHKQVDRAIEDTQTSRMDADGDEIYIIGNPGEGLTNPAFECGTPDHDACDFGEGAFVVNNPKAVRDYDSVEFAFEKRFADRWYLRTGYLWSRLWGNYSGLSQSDENGRTSPNVGRSYDYPMMMFKDGGVPDYGRLATDRPHQFKTQFIYQLPLGTSVGLNQYVASGLPVSRLVGIYPGNNLPVQYEGRMSDGRTPTFSQTDLNVQHEFKFGARRLQLGLNVINLFNQGTAVARFSQFHKVNGVLPTSEEAFYRGELMLGDLIASQHVTQDPRFLMDSAFQAPIQGRVSVKFLF